ncbi:MAG TPA: hypothetical protein VM802_25345 [Chitinophaga sp.]|uniref:hypothetical protein n=1 Tax=Chitinophaga sp. TaxID=1869181 RepID=UPI002D19F7DF|nr:hypothetical protein [Chitinophaga sp.]HVI48218.1 hypothetical protein [Chitinophaga sp.]
MKKKSVKKLSLGMIKVTRLGGASIMGGAGTATGPISGATAPGGPSGPNTLPPDPCASQYQACTMCCTLDCSSPAVCYP